MGIAAMMQNSMHVRPSCGRETLPEDFDQLDVEAANSRHRKVDCQHTGCPATQVNRSGDE